MTQIKAVSALLASTEPTLAIFVSSPTVIVALQINRACDRSFPEMP